MLGQGSSSISALGPEMDQHIGFEIGATQKIMIMAVQKTELCLNTGKLTDQALKGFHVGFTMAVSSILLVLFIGFSHGL